MYVQIYNTVTERWIGYVGVNLTINEGTFSTEQWEKLKLIDNFLWWNIYYNNSTIEMSKNIKNDFLIEITEKGFKKPSVIL